MCCAQRQGPNVGRIRENAISSAAAPSARVALDALLKLETEVTRARPRPPMPARRANGTPSQRTAEGLVYDRRSRLSCRTEQSWGFLGCALRDGCTEMSKLPDHLPLSDQRTAGLDSRRTSVWPSRAFGRLVRYLPMNVLRHNGPGCRRFATHAGSLVTRPSPSATDLSRPQACASLGWSIVEVLSSQPILSLSERTGS
jgi:hypothetical protein